MLDYSDVGFRRGAASEAAWRAREAAHVVFPPSVSRLSGGLLFLMSRHIH